MKLRSGHIAALVVVAFAFMVGLILLWSLWTGPIPEDEDSFLASVRMQRERGEGSRSAEGTITALPGKIVLETMEVDLGLVPNDRHTFRDFKVYNKGEGPLKIISVTSSCQLCTRVSLANEDKIIRPGGEVAIKVEFLPEGVPGFHSRKIVRIQSSDPVNTVLEVPVKAAIDPEFGVEPEAVDFGDVEKGSTVEQKVRVRQLTGAPFEITDVTMPGDRNSCEVDWRLLPEQEWTEADHSEYELTVRLLPDVKPDKFIDRIRIFTTCARLPWLDVQVSGNVVSFYTVKPEMLALRKAVKPGTKDALTAVITADKPIRVSGIVLDNADLSVVAKPGGSPNTVQLVLSVPETATAGFKKGLLSFDVTSGEKTVRHTMKVFASVLE